MPVEEIPPDWASVESDEEFQKLTPEDKAVTLGNWAKAVRSYGESMGAWEDPEAQKQFTETSRAKLQEYQSQFKDIPRGNLIDRANLGVQEFAPRAMGAADQLLALATRFPETVLAPFDKTLGTDLVKQYQEKNVLGKELSEMALRESAKAQEISEAGRALKGGPEIPVLGNVGDLIQEGIPTTLQAFMDIGLSGGSGSVQSLRAPVKTATEAILRNASAPAVRQAAAVAGGEQALATLNQDISQRVEAGEDLEQAQTRSLPKALSAGLVTALTTAFGGFSGAESVLKASGIRGLKNRIIEVLKESGMEATEETLDQAGNQIAGWWNDEIDPVKPKEGTWEQRLRNAVNLKDLAKSGFLGGIIGGNITAIGQAAEAIRDRGIVEQAAVQSERLKSTDSPLAARAVEEIAASDIADNRIASQRKSASVIDELLSTPEEQLAQPAEERIVPSGSEEQFAPPAEETEQPISQPDAARARVEEALIAGQTPSPEDVALAEAVVEPAQEGEQNELQAISIPEAVKTGREVPAEARAQENTEVIPNLEGILPGETLNENPPIQQDQPNVPKGVGADPTTEGIQPAVTPVSEGDAAGAQSPKRVQLRTGPQSFEVLEKLPQSDIERQNGEQYYRVRNERTGQTEDVEEGDIAREIRPKSDRVKKAVAKLPEKQRAKAEAATEISTEPDPYQGAPLSNSAPLPSVNIPLLNELSELGVMDEDATTAAVLQKIADSKSTPDWAKTLSRRLLALGTAMDIQVVNRPDSTWSALFDGQGPTTYINLARRNPGAALSILHEASHAATLSQIRNPGSLTGEARKAYEDLIAIHAEISSLPEFQGEYGISNVEEMVAEAFSNAGFRKKLDRLQPNQKQTFWQRLVNAIARLLFNKPAAQSSLLHRAIEDAFTLAGAPIIESRNGTSAAMAESGSWPDTLTNPNASEAAEAKSLIEATEEIESETKLDVTPLTEEQKALLEEREGFSPLGTIYFFAREFSTIQGSNFNDRRDEVVDALVKAAKLYKPEKGIPFFQWAGVVIRNHMRDYAKRLKVRNKYVTPDFPVSEDEEETVISTTPSPQDTVIAERDHNRMKEVAREVLSSVMEKAPERDRNILTDYKNGMNMRDVGTRNGVSAEGVRKIIKKYREAVEKAFFLRGVNDISEILSPAEETTESAVPTKAKTPYDEESYREVPGAIEEKEATLKSAILGEDDRSIPGPEEGFTGDTEQSERNIFDPYDDTAEYAEVGAYKSAPLEKELQLALERRPEVSAILSKYGSIFSRIGAEARLWNGGKFTASFLADGTPIVRVDPKILAQEPIRYIERVFEEETIHVLDNLINFQKFTATGRPFREYDEWNNEQSSALLNELIDTAASLPKEESDSVARALVSAYNLYNFSKENARVSDVKELVDDLDSLPQNRKGFLDNTGFVHEFARMIVQQRRNGEITEQTSSTILGKIIDWLRQGLDSIKRVAQFVSGNELKNTSFGKLAIEIEQLAEGVIPKEGLSRIAPMAERAIPESNKEIASQFEKGLEGQDKFKEVIAYEAGQSLDSILAAVLSKPAESVDDAYRRLGEAFKYEHGFPDFLTEKALDFIKAKVEAKALPAGPGAANINEPLQGYELRSFGERFVKDRAISKDIRDETGNRYYAPIPNQTTADEARRLIEQNGVDDAISQIKDEANGLPFHTRATVGQVVIKKLNQEYKRLKASDPVEAEVALRKATDLAEWQMEYGTRLGQGVQSFAMYSRLTPEGKLLSYQKSVRKARDRFKASQGEKVREIIDTLNNADDKEKAARDLVKRNSIAKTIKDKIGELVKQAKEGTLNEDVFYEKLAKKLGLPESDPKVAARILELAQKIDEAAEGIPKDRATLELAKYIAQQKGFAPSDVPFGMYYGNILSGYNTHLVNAIDTFLNVFSETSLLALTNPKAAARIYSGLFRGLGEGRADALLAISEGRIATGEKWMDVPKLLEVAEFGKKGGVPVSTQKKFGKVIKSIAESPLAYPLNAYKYVGRALSAVDSLNFRAAKEANAALLAYRVAEIEGLTGDSLVERMNDILALNRMPDLLRYAKNEGFTGQQALARAIELREALRDSGISEASSEFASEATYNHEPHGALGQISNTVGNLSNKLPIMKIFVPFTRIVANVTNRGLNYSPLGYKRAYLGYTGEEALTGEQRKQMLARANIGTAGLTALGILHALGVIAIHGAGPSDDDKRKQLQAAGWKPYSIKIGNVYYNYTYTPIGLGLSMLGNVFDSYEYGELPRADIGTRFAYAAMRVPSTVFSQSFLSGLSKLFDMISGGPGKSIAATKGVISSTAAAFTTPTIFRDISRLFDNNSYSSNNIAQDMIRNTPFAALSLKPSLNVLGEPIKLPRQRFFTTASDDPIWRMVVAKNLRIPVPSKTTPLKPGGLEPLSPDQYYEYVKTSGQRLKAWMEKNQSRLEKMNTEDADEAIAKESQRIHKLVLPKIRRT